MDRKSLILANDLGIEHTVAAAQARLKAHPPTL
jgi:hypothetical protein